MARTYYIAGDRVVYFRPTASQLGRLNQQALVVRANDLRFTEDYYAMVIEFDDGHRIETVPARCRLISGDPKATSAPNAALIIAQLRDKEPEKLVRALLKAFKRYPKVQSHPGMVVELKRKWGSHPAGMRATIQTKGTYPLDGNYVLTLMRIPDGHILYDVRGDYLAPVDVAAIADWKVESLRLNEFTSMIENRRDYTDQHLGEIILSVFP